MLREGARSAGGVGIKNPGKQDEETKMSRSIREFVVYIRGR